MHLVLLDGRLQPQLSRGMELLPGAMVYVGPVADAPTEAVSMLVRHTVFGLIAHTFVQYVNQQKSMSQCVSLVIHMQGSQTSARGGVFATLNGAVASDALCIVVSDNAEVEALIHVLHVSSSGTQETRHGVWGA